MKLQITNNRDSKTWNIKYINFESLSLFSVVNYNYSHYSFYSAVSWQSSFLRVVTILFITSRFLHGHSYTFLWILYIISVHPLTQHFPQLWLASWAPSLLIEILFKVERVSRPAPCLFLSLLSFRAIGSLI